jgi:hypothetical protein
MRSIELRRDCDVLYAQLVQHTQRLDASVNEVILRFSNMDDILPEQYVRFGFENAADVDFLRNMSNRVRSSRTPHPELEIQYLEQHPTSNVLSRRTPGDPTSTNEYYLPEAAPSLAAAPVLADIPAIVNYDPSIFAGQPFPEAPTAVLAGDSLSYPPPALTPAATAQPYAAPETYTTNPSPSAGLPTRSFGPPGGPLAQASDVLMGPPRVEQLQRPVAATMDPPPMAVAPWRQSASSPGQGGAAGSSSTAT